MANPALKNGYISIANELVEVLAKTYLKGEEMRIIWVVWRKTWGWVKGNRKKDWDWISISQFEEMANMKHSNVVRTLKSLVAHRLLLKEENRYKFNQNYEQWVVVHRLPPVVHRLLGSSPQTTKSSSPQTTNKRKKETNTKEIAKAELLQGEQWNELIDSFEPVNPMYKKFYSNKSERIALEELSKELGYEKVLGIIRFLPKSIGRAYAPKITKPTELVRDLGKLKAFWEQEKSKATQTTNKGRGFA